MALNQAAGTKAKALRVSLKDDLGHEAPRGSEPELGPPRSKWRSLWCWGPKQAGRSWLQEQRFSMSGEVPRAGGQSFSSWQSRPFPRDSEMGALPPTPLREARASQGTQRQGGQGDSAGQGGGRQFNAKGR